MNIIGLSKNAQLDIGQYGYRTVKYIFKGLFREKMTQSDVREAKISTNILGQARCY